MAAFQSEVEASVQDVSAFKSVVSLAAFLPFKTAADALNQINSVSEGVPTEELSGFHEVLSGCG